MRVFQYYFSFVNECSSRNTRELSEFFPLANIFQQVDFWVMKNIGQLIRKED